MRLYADFQAIPDAPASISTEADRQSQEIILGQLHREFPRDALCAECQERTEKNPLRVFDCKNPGCQAVLVGAPAITDALTGEARAHFETVQRQLGALGIPFRLNPRMVRGLDYYTRTAFEFLSDDPVLGTASAVGGGGRYDRLVKETVRSRWEAGPRGQTVRDAAAI